MEYFNLGLNGVKTQNEICNSDYDDFLEDVQLESSLESSLDNLITLKQALTKVNYAEDAIFVLKTDPIFNEIISSNSDPRIAIDTTIEKAYEHLMQDFLRWGLLGMAFGTYLASLGRISKSLNKALIVPPAKYKLNNQLTRVLYLPPYPETVSILAGLNLMHAGCMQFQKNPKAPIKPIIDGLRKCGFRITEEMVVKKHYTIDWGAVAGQFIGSLLWAYIGGYIGSRWLSEKGGTVANKGYDVPKFVNCCSELIKIMDKLPEMKRKQIMLPTENTTDLYQKLKFVKSASKIYLHTIKNLGRGLASAYYHLT